MKCVTEGCENDAAKRVYWPGSDPVVMCIGCADRARSLGAVLGVHIPVESLHE